MILCNGAPKTGTNLSQKLCGMLGVRDSELSFVGIAEQPGIGARQIVEEKQKVAVDPEAALAIGNDHFCHAHVTAPNWPIFRDHKVIVTYRDPRDAAVSLVRWLERRGQVEKADEAMLLDLLVHGYWARRRGANHTWVQFYSWFLNWRTVPEGVLTLEFHDLGKPETVARVADFIGVDDYDAEALAAGWLGSGKEWNGRPMYKSLSSYTGAHRSDWREWWTDRVEQAWQDTKGPELLQLAGYAE